MKDRSQPSEHATQNEIRNALVDEGIFFRANVGQAWASNDIAKLPDGSMILRNPRPFSSSSRRLVRFSISTSERPPRNSWCSR